MTIADTIKSLKPGDRVRVVHEVVVGAGPDCDGDVLVEDDYYLIHDDPTITSIEVIERLLAVGDRVQYRPEFVNRAKATIKGIDDGVAWLRWDDGTRSKRHVSDLRRAS